MPNPAYLLCDTDALLQVFITKRIEPLKELKENYGIQPSIVPEVETEVRSHSKFQRRFEPAYNKAISSGLLVVMDYGRLHTSLPGYFRPPAEAAATCQAITERGAQYNLRVGLGEAYTFAAASVLCIPAMSHDLEAINILQLEGQPVPEPILRFFDLIVFAFQTGVLDEKVCDNVRQVLASAREHLPKTFAHASFRSGLSKFVPRLQDSAKPPIGTNLGPRVGYQKILKVTRTR